MTDTMDDAKLIVGNVLLEFGMIDSMLRSIYKDQTHIDPTNKNTSDKELNECFFRYIDGRDGIVNDSKSKVFKGVEGDRIHLQDLLYGLRWLRNVAAHQTYSLVTGRSALSVSARGQGVDTFEGTLAYFKELWDLYSEQFYPIFELWNDGVLDYFDIDGTQIGEIE